MRSEASVEFGKIIRKIRINPQNGLLEFHKKYGASIKMAVRKITHTLDLYNEVENDILIKLWQKAPFIDEKQIRSPNSWVFVVTSNCLKDKLRAKKVYCALYENISCERNFLQEFIDDDSFYGQIAVLPSKEQDVIIKKLMLNYTFEEIAELNQMPLSTVSSMYYRAVNKLKKENLNKF